MSLGSFIRKQFIDIIQYTEDVDGVLAYRFPMQDFEIQYGAKLTVRESQAALFVNEGQIADQFGPGLYTLTTHTLPILTYLKNWDKLFESPFKSDVYFFSTRLQINRKWGTPNPVTIRDKEFGAVRLRAFGIYSYKVSDPKVFHKTISGTRARYTVDDLDEQPRPAFARAPHRRHELAQARQEAVVADAQQRPGRDVADTGRFDHDRARPSAREPLVPREILVGDEALLGGAPRHHRRHPRAARELHPADGDRAKEQRALGLVPRRPAAGRRLPFDPLRRTPHAAQCMSPRACRHRFMTDFRLS